MNSKLLQGDIFLWCMPWLIAVIVLFLVLFIPPRYSAVILITLRSLWVTGTPAKLKPLGQRLETK